MKKAHYHLDDVRQAIASGNYQFSPRALRDYRNLSYTEDLAISIVDNLTEKDYRKTIAYDDYVCDVYHIEHCFNGYTDCLYIKFYMENGNLELEIVSFHL